MPIRLSKASLGSEEKQRISEVIDQEYLGMGTFVKNFEDRVTEYLGTSKKIVSVSTGTAALHVALESLQLPPGTEVAVPDLTYVASLQAITAAGLKPLICDIREDGFIDVQDLDRRMTQNVKCIMPVHYASASKGMSEVYDYASSKGLRVVEDAAHSFGCLRDGKKVGALSEEDIVCFSFDGIKNVTCGEGGALLTSDSEVASVASDMRLLSVEKDTEARFNKTRSWDFDVRRQGYRYHLSNVHAAIGIEQMAKIESFRDRKAKIFNTYVKALSKIDGVRPLLSELDGMIPHIFVIQTRDQKVKSALKEHLRKAEIETGEHYRPNHLLSYYRTSYELPRSLDFYHRSLSIPFHADLKEGEVETVIQAIQGFFHG